MAEQTAASAVHVERDLEASAWASQAESAAPVGLLTRAKFTLVRGLLVGLMRVLGLRGLYAIGCAFGTCEWLINYRLRRRVRNRLKAMLGAELSKRQIARATHKFFMRVRCDKILYLIFDRISKPEILKRLEFEGKEHIDAALARGHGVYVMLSHHGAHHVAALLMALLGYKVAGVRDRKESALRRYVQGKYAETFPEFRHLRLFFADAFPRGLYRCFRENYVVGTALDVDRARAKHLKTAEVRLFGQPQRFLTGTVQIALRCGAPIVQGFVVSCKDYRFRLVVSPPLEDPSGAAETPETIQKIMERYAAGIEWHVRKYPCHISKF